jgi:hypothetical protein
MSSLTLQNIDVLGEEARKTEAKHKAIKNSLWNADLDKL